MLLQWIIVGTKIFLMSAPHTQSTVVDPLISHLGAMHKKQKEIFDSEGGGGV